MVVAAYPTHGELNWDADLKAYIDTTATQAAADAVAALPPSDGGGGGVSPNVTQPIIRFFSPMQAAYGAVGDGIADDGDAIRACCVAASVAGGIVIIDRAYAFTGKIKLYGGMSIWQVSSRKILLVPQEGWTEPGLVALDSTAWVEYGETGDGSGSANDNPGAVMGLSVDGKKVTGDLHDGLFVCDAAEPSIYDLQVTNSLGAGFFGGRSQNMNIHNLRTGGNKIGVLLEPLVAGQQGPGHIIFFGGHINDDEEPIVVDARGATDFFGAHDIVFSKTLIETGRVDGQPVRFGFYVNVGDVTFDDCNFTFGAKVGGSTGNPVVEDCVGLVDNSVFTGYSSRVHIRGGSLGGGVNGVTDAIRVKQHGSANIISKTGTVAFANIDYKVCQDGIAAGAADNIMSWNGLDVEVTGGISDMRAINGATLLNGANKQWMGLYLEMPDGLLNGNPLINGNFQNALLIKHKDEAAARVSIDWNGTQRYLDPLTGLTIGSTIRNNSTWGVTGRWGIANGLFRAPSLVNVTTSGAQNIAWDSTSYVLWGLATNINITSVTLNPTVGGATPTEGQEVRIGIALPAGATPGTITWPAGLFFDPVAGPPQPVANLTQYVTLVFRTGVGWCEESRSHYSAGATPSAAGVTFSPTGDLVSTNVQAAIGELDTIKADAVATQAMLDLKLTAADTSYTGDLNALTTAGRYYIPTANATLANHVPVDTVAGHIEVLNRAGSTLAQRFTAFNGSGVYMRTSGSGGSSWTAWSTVALQEATAPQVTRWLAAVANAAYTIPAGAKYLRIRVLGAGGGGGSGRRGAAASIRCGGGGGAGGALSDVFVDVVNDLAGITTLYVTVGAGGPGGAAVTADSTSGNAGTAGALSSVKTTNAAMSLATAVCAANGGGGGAGGTTGTGTGGAGSVGTSFSASGAAASTTGGAGAGGIPVTGGAGSPAGAGGGITAADVPNAGGNGSYVPGTYTAAVPGGAVGANGGDGVNQPSAATPGQAGSGGGASITAAAGAGGKGGRGSGGGGGGGSLNGFNSGKGGDGGDGFVEITAWF